MTVLLTLHITRNSDHASDDTIAFQTDPAYPDVVEITSTFGDSKKLSYKYTLPRGRCPHYARTVVRALVDDAEPFDRLQINSAMFPAVMYNVEDLGRSRVMDAIDEILYLTFDAIIHRQ
jgi:hypothetical protein